jgi:ADP-ribosylglycohydrolase
MKMEKKKVENMVLGIAIGDAFGLGIEFMNKDWIKKNIDFTKFVNMREGKYNENYELGYYSDDTEQSIGLIKALISGKAFNEELLISEWKKEWERSTKERGFPRQGYSTNTQRWLDEEISVEELRASQNKENPGCAPPMRAIPLGLISSELLDKYAIINADASNNLPKAEAGSTMVARASEYMIVKEGNPKEIIKYCIKFIKDEDSIKYLQEVDKLPSELNDSEFEILCGPQPIPRFKHREVIGMPCSAMRVGGCALYVVKHAKDTFDGLKKAIKLGGDIDTIASICTGILAGRYGLESVPKFMIEKTEGKEMLKKVAGKFTDYLNKK